MTLAVAVISSVALSLAIGVTTPAWAASSRSTEAKLGKIRKQIADVQKTLIDKTTERDALTVKLRDSELTVSNGRRKLEDLRAQRNAVERRRAELQQRHQETGRILKAEREALASQLRAAQAMGGAGAGGGQKEQLKMLFNQQDPVRVGRMFAYYGYFGRARADHIHTIRDQLQALEELDRELQATNEDLVRLEEEAGGELKVLQRARAERASVVRDLEEQIKSRQTRLARLKKQEDTLEKLLADLRRVTADFPVTSEEPFEKAKGRLSWPVSGRIVANFGEPRAAGLNWNGVMLATERGSQVRAVYFGRVIYSDYLPGMGLLTIVEHRGGYLSLYGHNEQLFKSVGDWVEPGDVIASAGDSGGRGRPELYFEIRKGAKPLNPRQWVRK